MGAGSASPKPVIVDSTVCVLHLSQEKKCDILEEKRKKKHIKMRHVSFLPWGPKCKHKLSNENDGRLLP